MKKFIIVISALCGISSYGATFAQSTNDAINVPVFGQPSNAVVLGKNGDVKVGGTLTVPGNSTLSGTNNVLPVTSAGTQIVASVWIPVSGSNGTNYYIKAFLKTGP